MNAVLQPAAAGTESPTESMGSSAATRSESMPVTGVSDGLQDDADREERIRHHRVCMEAAMGEYERTSCFTARGQADFHRIQFEREIAARSPAQRARLQAQQAERMRQEPGAPRQ